MASGWWAAFGGTLAIVFLAELGDKTQLAVLAQSAARGKPLAVLLGGAAALLLSTAIAVVVGTLLRQRLDPRWLHYGAAALFLIFGAWMLVAGPGK